MAAERIIAVGLARPLPIMSGAVPWQGWKTAWVSPNLAEHVLHHHDVEIPWSPYQHGGTGVDVEPLGGDAGMARGAFVEDLAEEGVGFERIGLVDAASLPGRPRALRHSARRNENSNRRSEVLRVINSVSRASSRVTTPLPMDENSPSVDSRIRMRSMPRSAPPTIGQGTPDTNRAGRTPA